MKRFFCVVLLVFSGVAGNSLRAQITIRTWTGTVNNVFLNTLNWLPEGPPENADVIIPQSLVSPVLSAAPFANINSVHIQNGGRLDIVMAGELNTTDSIRVDSNGVMLINSLAANFMNIGGNCIVNGTMTMSDSVVGTMLFDQNVFVKGSFTIGGTGIMIVTAKLVVDSGGAVHIGGSIDVPNIGDDLVLNGSLIIDSTQAPAIYCNGDWRRGPGSIFVPGGSKFYFTNDVRALNIDRGVFNNLVLGPAPLVAMLEDVTVNDTLRLRAPSIIHRGATLTINNPEPTIIRDTGTVVSGRIRRAIDTTSTGHYRFHHDNIALEFHPGAVSRPAYVSITAEPDTLFDTSGGRTFFVRRFYDIEREGGSDFSARLFLHYLESELRDSVDESQLSLWRTTDDGVSWIHVGGVVDATNNVIVVDTVREFSKWGFGSPFAPPITSVESGEDGIPLHMGLAQNYPNPFNPRTRIPYSLSTVSFTTIRIFNLLGQEIAALVQGEQPPGNYEIEWVADGLPSGVYFYRLQAGRFIQTRKMILIR